MFRNVRLYSFTNPWPESEVDLSAALQKAAFKPCGPLTERSNGWEPPAAEAGDSLARRVNGADLIRLRSQSRVLPAAAVNEELEVYYQPKLDLKEGLILSYEALIRWSHPERGLVSPQEFVAIAEENGLISDLGAYVLYAACSQTKKWQDMGFGPLSVSVNLAQRQFLELIAKLRFAVS